MAENTPPVIEERKMNDELCAAIFEVRKWQRHWLMRQFGSDGRVLPENIKLAAHLNIILAAAEGPNECPDCGHVDCTVNH